MNTVLIVDDEIAIRDSLALALRQKYDVICADSGEQALEMITADVKAVLLDIKMPGMDGFDTSNEIKKINPTLPIIFHTAYQNMKDPFDVMNQNQPFGFLTKGSSLKILKDTLASAINHYDNIKNIHFSEVRQDISSGIQASLLPRMNFINDKVYIVCNHKSSEKIGGDWFLHEIKDNILNLYMGDVAGQGFHAALLSATIKGAVNVINDELYGQEDLEAFKQSFQKLNKVLLQSNQKISMSLILVRVDLENNLCYYANKVAQPILYFDLDEKSCDFYGVSPNIVEEQKDLKSAQYDSIKLAKNWMLLLMTDGLIKAIDKEGQEFGLSKFHSLMCQNIELSPEELKELILKELESYKLNDDCSFMIVKNNFFE